jgi:hypothetical protein
LNTNFKYVCWFRELCQNDMNDRLENAIELDHGIKADSSNQCTKHDPAA